MLTTQWPSCVCWAIAYFTAVPVSSAGPSMYRALAVPGQPGQQDRLVLVIRRCRLGRREGGQLWCGTDCVMDPCARPRGPLQVCRDQRVVRCAAGGQGLGSGGGGRGLRLGGGVGRGVAERGAEVELGGRADLCDHLPGVLHPRDRHHDLVALRAHCGPRHPEAVHPVGEDGHGFVQLCIRGLRGRLVDDREAPGEVEAELGLPAGRHGEGQRAEGHGHHEDDAQQQRPVPLGLGAGRSVTNSRPRRWCPRRRRPRGRLDRLSSSSRS